MSKNGNGVENKEQLTNKIKKKIKEMVMMLPLVILILLAPTIGMALILPIYYFFQPHNYIIEIILLLFMVAYSFFYGKIVYYCLNKIANIVDIASNSITIEKYKLSIKANKELQEKYIDAKLQSKPLQHSFLTSLSMTIIGGLGFLFCVLLYWYFQDAFVIKPEFYDIKNDFCKLALVVLSRTPIIVFFIVGLLICKRCFTLWDKYRDYLSLWEYHSRINDKDKQDDLLIALAPNYFGTKRNRRSDNNFMEKLLLKMIPTLNINAGGGSNNGNNGGQNGGQNP